MSAFTMRLLVLLLGLLWGLVHGACPRGVYNNKICSGHGRCNPHNLCVCDVNHSGFDCSQRLLAAIDQTCNRCPLGPAWVAPARAPDDAHYPVECSNKGVCDRETGACTCDEGFVGSACQRLACRDNCDDAGDCLSLKHLSAVYAVGSEPLYDNVWDADMIYGCKCRKGYHGYDCTMRSCPRGDDPLTTGQKNEVQIIQCTATGGFFYLFFNGEGAQVPFDVTVSQLSTILASVRTLPQVKITFAGATTTVCSNTAPVPVLIEFTYAFGPQPAIKVLGALKNVVSLTGGVVLAASGGAVLGGRTSTIGSKEWEFCSNRGDCNSETGQCTCFTTPMPGYRSSDGYGNPGTRGDCGCANDKNFYGGPISACVGELACSGHGYCTGFPSFKCVCEKSWTGGDCSSRVCPAGPSWYTAPSASNTVHDQWAECSNMGHCDRVTGECSCYTPFEGVACEFMKCSGESACSGHGQCMSIRQLSLEADVDSPSLQFDYGADPNNVLTFDRDSILGCKCDPEYEGYDCSQRSCPKGDDPVTTDQVDEIQVLQCTGTGGHFRLQYRTSTSARIPFDATATTLRNILVFSFGFDDPVVQYSSGTQACSPPTASVPNIITISFLLDHGDIPPLAAITRSLTVSGGIGTVATADNGVAIGGVTSQQGTKENVVCSNRGHCNYQQGTCTCSFGFGSSDGRGNRGNRGDCGYILPKKSLLDVHTTVHFVQEPMLEASNKLNSHDKPNMRRTLSGPGALKKAPLPKHHVDSNLPSRRTLAPTAFSSMVAQARDQRESGLIAKLGGIKTAAGTPSPGKMKLERALHVKDQCDRELQAICEAKRRQHRSFSALDSSNDVIFLEQEKSSENMIRDKRDLERLMRKLSPAMSHFACTHSEFVHILQGCSTCSNRLAFCAACTEKATEFFSGFTSSELFALYGSELPPANDSELVSFVEAVAIREARAIRSDDADDCYTC